MFSLEETLAAVTEWRRAGRRIVLTHGVFDLIHPGHVRLLTAARSQGDALVVAISSDRAALEQKGEGRPITPAHERAELIAAMAAVDIVAIVDEAIPASAIESIQPDVIVLSGDVAETVADNTLVGGRPTKMVMIPRHGAFSSGALVEKIRDVGRPR